MKIVFKYKFQITLILLTTLFSCYQQKSDAQNRKPNENPQELTLNPLRIITGEEYKEKLFVAINQETKKMGLYNVKNEEILPVIYDEVYSSLVNPHYVVVYENRRKGLFDLKGKRICESIYDGFVLSPSDSSIIGAYLGSQEKWRIINNKGERVFSEDYAKIELLHKGLVILQKEDLTSSLASIKGESITGFEFQFLQGIGKNKIDEQWYVDNDIVAKAVAGIQTIFVNSKGEIVDK